MNEELRDHDCKKRRYSAAEETPTHHRPIIRELLQKQLWWLLRLYSTAAVAQKHRCLVYFIHFPTIHQFVGITRHIHQHVFKPKRPSAVKTTAFELWFKDTKCTIDTLVPMCPVESVPLWGSTKEDKRIVSAGNWVWLEKEEWSWWWFVSISFFRSTVCIWSRNAHYAEKGGAVGCRCEMHKVGFVLYKMVLRE